MESLVHTLDLACDPGHAFEVFTGRMGRGGTRRTPPTSPLSAASRSSPHVGGGVAMLIGEDHYPFGTVTAWQPGMRYGQTFWLGMESGHPSTLTATFALGNGGCEMRFEHGGWDAHHVDVRDKYAAWPALLARFQREAD